MQHASFLRDLLDKNGGFMIPAHPYRRNFSIDSDIDEAVDQF